MAMAMQFIALAAAFNAPLVTLDTRIARVISPEISSHQIKIDLVAGR
ncbi:MAG: hypothetical protein OXG50_13760 [bacterium]|nr:hypothetical protein [bacterium]